MKGEENKMENKETLSDYNDVYEKLCDFEDLQDLVGISLKWFFTNAMGKNLYYLDVDDGYISSHVITGIGIKDTWNENLPFYYEIPDGHKREFLILTDCCGTFDPKKYKEEWFLNEDEAEEYFKSQL